MTYNEASHPVQMLGKKNAYLQNFCMMTPLKGGLIRSAAVKPDEGGVKVWEETQQCRHTWNTVCFHTSSRFLNFGISKQRERKMKKKSRVQKVMGPPVQVMTTTPIQVFLPPSGTTLLLIRAGKHVGGAAEHGGFSGGAETSHTVNRGLLSYHRKVVPCHGSPKSGLKLELSGKCEYLWN